MRDIIIDERAYVEDGKVICFEKGAFDLSNQAHAERLRRFAECHRLFMPVFDEGFVWFLLNDSKNPGNFFVSQKHITELPQATQDFIRQACPELFS